MSVLVPPRVYEQIVEAVDYARHEYGDTTAQKLGDSLFELIHKADILPGASLPGLPAKHFRLSARRYPYMLLCRRRARSNEVVVYLLWYSKRPMPASDELERVADEANREGYPPQS